jgi:hypothetical protein
MPSSWLIRMIKPFYKNKGDKFDPKNYRPITIVSCLGKLFTAILNERLTEFSTVSPYFWYTRLLFHLHIWQLFLFYNMWRAISKTCWCQCDIVMNCIRDVLLFAYIIFLVNIVLLFLPNTHLNKLKIRWEFAQLLYGSQYDKLRMYTFFSLI